MNNKQLQVALNVVMGTNLTVDGKIGQASKKAIRDFQRRFNLTVDGVAGPNTKQKLKDAQTQALLNRAGHNLKVDGVIGAKSINAIKDFQRQYGLKVDGIAGANTQYDLMFYKYPHFKKSEFACKCKKYCNGHPVKVDENLLILLEQIRAEVGKPLIINSGIRCTTHNRNVGGAKTSQHLKGTAVDIRSSAGVSKLYSVADKLNPTGGVGRYNTFVHVDTRPSRSRW